MKVQQIIVVGQNQVELQERDLDDRLGPDEILVKTEWTFISAGTELANYTGKEPQVFQKGSWCAYPWNSGYANVGIVMNTGSEVSCCKVGDRVFTFGSHSSMVKWNQKKLVVAVPDEIAPDIAVATRMAGVATAALLMADMPVYPWVVVFGLGMVGNLAAQAFRIKGGRVIGVDPVENRRRLASRCGIRHVIGGSPDEVQQLIFSLTEGAMADIAVEATGLTPVILQAVRAAANFGQVILLGSPRAPFQGDMTPVFSDIHLRYITVRGALEWGPPSYPPTSAVGGRTSAMISLYEKQKMIFDWVQRGEMQIDPLISHRIRPAQIKEAYEGLLRQPDIYIGVAIDWR